MIITAIHGAGLVGSPVTGVLPPGPGIGVCVSCGGPGQFVGVVIKPGGIGDGVSDIFCSGGGPKLIHGGGVGEYFGTMVGTNGVGVLNGIGEPVGRQGG